ncbi:putative superoxide dismutase [Symbiobacterium thermophilum IAM 14863]|uniref:superoxide dismutase n=1 Tax=Symbiobacterium thermophilum (strain DSM 24528 / JCM 14929 / IAM 14863 / T) TaxID=292459 RepID=Q67T03_SYMTH|nr:putative superoxide dismutase [Symbiobacterium thermophilum IAM 14863]
MFGFDPYDSYALVCQHIADWARQARTAIACLKPEGGAADDLSGWQERFEALEREAQAALRADRSASGRPDAAALMRRAYEALTEFVRAAAGRGVPPAGELSPPRPVPPGGHRLPPLPYPYDALEPYIDAETMRLHHDRHHRSYVEGLNRAERALAEARAAGDWALVKHWERELAFNGAGHYLHTLFWESMAPGAGGEPGGEVLAQIRQDFGDFRRFREQFSKAAENVEGGGWAVWVWAPRANRTEILTAEKHQNLSQWDVVPLLPLDVWEHAYYLKYRNDRAAYIEQWWNVVNWPAVERRLREARRIAWEPT